jgi:hypothetical protein
MKPVTQYLLIALIGGIAINVTDRTWTAIAAIVLTILAWSTVSDSPADPQEKELTPQTQRLREEVAQGWWHVDCRRCGAHSEFEQHEPRICGQCKSPQVDTRPIPSLRSDA